MKSIEDIIAVLLSGSILIFSFFYVVNFQAKLFSDLFENKQKIEKTKQEIEEIRKEREELRQKHLKLEEEHARIDSFGFHLHSKRKR